MGLKLGQPSPTIQLNNQFTGDTLQRTLDPIAEKAGLTREEANEKYAARNHLHGRPVGNAQAATVDRLVATVSDYHMASGRTEVRGVNKSVALQFTPNEEEIRSEHAQRLRGMLRHMRDKATAGSSLFATEIDSGKLGPKAGEAYRVVLQLNGDTFEFLQMATDQPGKRFPDGRYDNGIAKDTPANAMVKLAIMADGHPIFFEALAEHVAAGHEIVFLPGNHDAILGNKHVWNGDILCFANPNEPNGFELIDLSDLSPAKRDAVQAQYADKKPKRFFGVAGIVENILKEQHGLSGGALENAMKRFRLSPMEVTGGEFFVHGHQSDSSNSYERNFKEFIDPTGLREEVKSNFGDEFVRNWFIGAEDDNRSLDGIGSTKRMASLVLGVDQLSEGDLIGFAKSTSSRFTMLQAAITALSKNGYDVSPEQETAQRKADIHALVERFPHIAVQINHHRAQTGLEPLTPFEAGEKLNTVFERSGPVGLQQSFKAGEGFFTRVAKLVARQASTTVTPLGTALRGVGLEDWAREWDNRSTRERYKGMAAELANELGLAGLSVGHTHVPEAHVMVTSQLMLARYTNTFTWTEQEGFGAADSAVAATYTRGDTGVQISEIGRSEDGTPYVVSQLCKVKNEGGVSIWSPYAEKKLSRSEEKEVAQRFQKFVQDYLAANPTGPTNQPSVHFAARVAFVELRENDVLPPGLLWNGELDFERALAEALEDGPAFFGPIRVLQDYLARFGFEALQTAISEALPDTAAA